MLNKKLSCCSACFTLFGVVFFINAISTLFTARWNASYIAQTGYMPWTHEVPGFIPSEEPAKYEFGLYDNFLKMGVLCAIISMVLFQFVMRTVIAKWLSREKNSKIAFRRTIYCLVAFIISYYFLHAQTVRFQEVYPMIAEERGIPGAPGPIVNPVDLGGRYL